MRIRLPLGRTLFFAGVFLLSVVAFIPLRVALDWVALDDRGLSARQAQGSLWSGSLAEAQIGPVPLGKLEARLRALPLFIGRAAINFSRDDEAAPLRGTATIFRHSFALDDVTADMDVTALFRPLPIASIDLEDVSVRFADGLCESAEGRVKAGMMGEVAGMTLPGGLSGNTRCDGAAVLLPLAGQSGMEALNLRFFADGRYEAEIVIRPSGGGMAERLLAAGFAAGENGAYLLRTGGEL